MTDPLASAEFIDGYLAEAEEHLSSSRANLVAIDEAHKKRARNPGAVRNLFRSIHTIKGLSAMVGAEPIVDIAHEMETLLRSADQSGGKLGAQAVDGILKGLRAIEERLRSLGRREPLAAAPRALLDVLSALQVEGPARDSSLDLSLAPELLAKLSSGEREQLSQGLQQGRRAVRVDFVPSQARAAEGVNITRVRERVAALAELIKVIPFTGAAGEAGAGKVAFALLLLTDASDAAVAEAASSTPEGVRPITLLGSDAGAPAGDAPDSEEPLVTPEPGERNFVRVEVGRLDDALERLAALVVTRSRLERACGVLVGNANSPAARELLATVAEQHRQLRDLRAAIMRARMVPLSDVLARVPLLLRGLTRSSNKAVQLDIDAGHSELDKAVADRLFPAIVHLLRNAVDHALESVEERRQKGKPVEGRLSIRCAERSGNQLALEITDDGRGVDRAKVAAKAGLPVPRDAAELLALLVRPGLSTREQATQLSGRGMGMDIVKRIVVDELGGKLALWTAPDQGSRFTLTVPLSVTVLEAFSFACAERTFVIPVSAVEALAEIEPGRVKPAPNPGNGAAVRVLDHRGAAVPLFRLSSLLGFACDAPPSSKAILVRRESELLAFEVDRMLGQQEIVVRPLTDPLVSVIGVTGSTDLGDGRPTLVLDPLLLVQRSTSEARA